MRRSFLSSFFALAPLLVACVLAGCSSAPAPETASEKAPESAPEPAPAAATETTPADPGAPAPEAAASPAPAAAPVAVNTEEEKTIYALGLVMARNMGDFALSGRELEIVKRALSDAAANKPLVDLEVYGPKLNDLARSRATKGAEIEKTRGKEYQAKAGKQKGAQTLPSGLVYRELTAGSGASPKASDNVKVHYRGTLTNGTEFDSSYKRNEPASFPLSGVIPCWTEGVQKMKVGGKAQLVCPSDIAYGDSGRPPQIPGGSTLVFEVELLAIN